MKNRDWINIFQAFGLLAQLGIIMVITIGIGFLSGSFIDKYIGECIIFRVTGIFLGIVSGFYTNYRLIMDFMNNTNNDD